MGDVELSFEEYSASKRVHLRPDVVEYPRVGAPPLYNLIIGKQTLHDIVAILHFNEKTITINEILLPMRNINNMQFKPSNSRTLKQHTCLAQEPVSTHNGTKCVIEILDAKYDAADLSSIVCTKPFPQTRDAAQQKEKEEHAHFIWKKLRLQDLKKGFPITTKMCVCVLTAGSEGLPYYAVPAARLIHPPQHLQCYIPTGLHTPASPSGDVS